jgi:hypothetical protein
MPISSKKSYKIPFFFFLLYAEPGKKFHPIKKSFVAERVGKRPLFDNQMLKTDTTIHIQKLTTCNLFCPTQKADFSNPKYNFFLIEKKVVPLHSQKMYFNNKNII